MSLRISAASGLRAARGDFNARLVGDELQVPPEIARVLSRHKVRTAEELLDRSRSFPSALATALGWTIRDLVDARAALVGLLTGHVRDVFLNPTDPPRVALGALAPDDASVKPGHLGRFSKR